MVAFEGQEELVRKSLSGKSSSADVWLLQSTEAARAAVAETRLGLSSRVFLFATQWGPRGGMAVTLEEAYRACDGCLLRMNGISPWQVTFSFLA